MAQKETFNILESVSYPVGNMPSTPTPFNRRIHYLKLYLNEHPTGQLSTFVQRRLELAQAGMYPAESLGHLTSYLKKVRRKERMRREGNYRMAWEHYQVRLNLPEPFDPDCDAVDVTLVRKDGQEYWAQFTTMKFLNSSFERNKKTGECAHGTYFCMPNMIVVERITEDSVRRTIDDLIGNFELEESFSLLDKTQP